MSKKAQIKNDEITANLLKTIARNDELFSALRKSLGLTARQLEKYLDTVESAPCNTMSVIELVDFKVIGVTTFPNTAKGNEAAEALFIRLHKEHNDPDGTTGVPLPSIEDFQEMFVTGNYNDECGYQIVIIPSV